MFGTGKAELRAIVAVQDCTIRFKDVLLKSRAKQIESLTRSRDELAAKVAELTAEVERLRAPAPTETSLPHVPQPLPTWTEWNGGECPVPGDTVVEVRFFDGSIVRNRAGEWNYCWKGKKGFQSTIAAYRIVP